MSTETRDVVEKANRSVANIIADSWKNTSTTKKCALVMVTMGVIAGYWYFSPISFASIVTELGTLMVTLANWLVDKIYALFDFFTPDGIVWFFEKLMDIVSSVARPLGRSIFDAAGWMTENVAVLNPLIAGARSAAGSTFNSVFGSANVEPILSAYRIGVMMISMFFVWAVNKILEKLRVKVLDKNVGLPNFAFYIFKASFHFAKFVWKFIVLIALYLAEKTKTNVKKNDNRRRKATMSETRIKMATQSCIEKLLDILDSIPFMTNLLNALGLTKFKKDLKEEPLLDDRIKDIVATDEVSVQIGVKVRSLRITPKIGVDERSFKFLDGSIMKKGTLEQAVKMCNLSNENIEDAIAMYASETDQSTSARTEDIIKTVIKKSELVIQDSDENYLINTKILLYYALFYSDEEVEELISYCKRPNFGDGDIETTIENLKSIGIKNYMLRSIFKMLDTLSKSSIYKSLPRIEEFREYLGEKDMTNESGKGLVESRTEDVSMTDIDEWNWVSNISSSSSFSSSLSPTKKIDKEENTVAKELAQEAENIHAKQGKEAQKEFVENISFAIESSKKLKETVPEILSELERENEDTGYTREQLGSLLQTVTSDLRDNQLRTTASTSTIKSTDTMSSTSQMDEDQNIASNNVNPLLLSLSMISNRDAEMIKVENDREGRFEEVEFAEKTRYVFSSIDLHSRFLTKAYRYLRGNDPNYAYPKLPEDGVGEFKTHLIRHCYAFHKLISRFAYYYSVSFTQHNDIFSENHSDVLPKGDQNSSNSTSFSNVLSFDGQRRIDPKRFNERTSKLPYVPVLLPTLNTRMGIFSVPKGLEKDFPKFIAHTIEMITKSYKTVQDPKKKGGEDVDMEGKKLEHVSSQWFDKYERNSDEGFDNKERVATEAKGFLKFNHKDEDMDFLKKKKDKRDDLIPQELFSKIWRNHPEFMARFTHITKQGNPRRDFTRNVFERCLEYDPIKSPTISFIFGINSEEMNLKSELYLFAYGEPIQKRDRKRNVKIEELFSEEPPCIKLDILDTYKDKDHFMMYKVGIIVHKRGLTSNSKEVISVYHLPSSFAYIKIYHNRPDVLFGGFNVDFHEVLLACAKFNMVHCKTPFFRKYQLFNTKYMAYDSTSKSHKAILPTEAKYKLKDTEVAIKDVSTLLGLNSIISWTLRTYDIYRNCMNGIIQLNYNKIHLQKSGVVNYNSRQYDAMIVFLEKKANLCKDILSYIEDRIPKNFWFSFCTDDAYLRHQQEIIDLGTSLEKLSESFAKVFYDDSEELVLT